MTKYDVRLEPMADNPVIEERGLGRKSGLFRLELWERVITSPKNFEFVRVLIESLSYEDAQQQQFELLNSLNATPPAVS